MKFSKETAKNLGFYVYALIDPRDDSIFYVGKASGNNRAFSHLSEKRNAPEKNIRIKAIRQDNEEPRVEILRHGIESENACLDVEATVIDAIGIENLTNEIRGHGTSRGRQKANEVDRLLGSKPIDIEGLKNNYMVFFIHKSYSPTMSETELYDCTRQFWHNVSHFNRTVIRKDGNIKYPTALAVVDSVVIRAYSILNWFPAGSTLSSRHPSDPENRWEFIGQLIDNHSLLNKRLQKNNTELKATQNRYTYLSGTDQELNVTQG